MAEITVDQLIANATGPDWCGGPTAPRLAREIVRLREALASATELLRDTTMPGCILDVDVADRIAAFLAQCEQTDKPKPGERICSKCDPAVQMVWDTSRRGMEYRCPKCGRFEEFLGRLMPGEVPRG